MYKRQLLDDENNLDSSTELAPDFTDGKVLNGLLTEADDSIDPNDRTTEIEDINEFDNVDFDELLADIEEETSISSDDEFELSDNFDIGDDFELESLDDDLENDETNRDFVSVDSLISDSMSDGKPTQSYEQVNIDVGLDEFPEFAGNTSKENLDDDNGASAKLDLAKVYLEMGDNENAEVILLEVISQGSAKQQREAQQLLDNF